MAQMNVLKVTSGDLLQSLKKCIVKGASPLDPDVVDACVDFLLMMFQAGKCGGMTLLNENDRKELSQLLEEAIPALDRSLFIYFAD